MRELIVNCSSSYKAVIGDGAIKKIAEFMPETAENAKTKVCLIISDALSAVLQSEITFALNNGSYDVFSFVLPDGERLKTVENLKIVTEFLNLNGFTKKDVIINVGGGTVSDFGGFLAAIYKRGLKYINVPTTLLSAVDACLGGKTAVDVDGVKNVWGLVYQPFAVVIDTLILKALPDEIFAQGLSEIVKYGIIDQKFGDFLITLNGVTGIKDNFEQVIFKCLSIKAGFVEKDEFDKAERRALNLGHTYAHGLESKSNYAVTHGEAVAAGLLAESRLSLDKGYISEERFNTILRLLSVYFKSVREDSLVELIPFMRSDKKNENDRICFSLPYGNVIKQVYFTEKELIIK